MPETPMVRSGLVELRGGEGCMGEKDILGGASEGSNWWRHSGKGREF